MRSSFSPRVWKHCELIILDDKSLVSCDPHAIVSSPAVPCCSSWILWFMSRKWTEVISSNGIRPSIVWNSTSLWRKRLIKWLKGLAIKPKILHRNTPTIAQKKVIRDRSDITKIWLFHHVNAPHHCALRVTQFSTLKKNSSVAPVTIFIWYISMYLFPVSSNQTNSERNTFRISYGQSVPEMLLKL